ncbi:MAG: hypothetical protein HC784_01540 [Hydrococcus sp. CSU_1_8]|nr:hypothetical protein [Hydrococcus sp. CSU_1_8]
MKLKIIGKCGSLNQFVRKVKNSKGQIVLYPKVKGQRNPNNPRHWAWNLTWKDKVDDKFISRSTNVPPGRVSQVKAMILENLDISEIQAFLKR